MAQPADVVAYSQEQFRGAYEGAEARGLRLQKEFKLRRFVAYCLKAVVALGGLAITAGLSHGAAQAVGVVIAAAVILDSEVFSNYKRLLATATAEAAMRRLVEGIQHQHQVGLVTVLDLKAKDEDGSKKTVVPLLQRLATQVT